MKEECVQTIDIQVTPRKYPDGYFECDINGGAEVVDEAICLKNGTYQINFTLDQNCQWSWDSSRPFQVNPGKCPRENHPADHPHFEVVDPVSPKSFTVEARSPGNNKRIFHYRLNFENGDTYDPIIIRE
jgi:hypothetical protein